MDNTLILVRHVSGAGSSTLAETLKSICDIAKVYCVIAAADQYFEKDGKYDWYQEGLRDAHAECYNKVSDALYFKVPLVIVTNTFTSERDMKEYIKLAEEYDYKLVTLVLENRHGNKNVHDVPEKTLIRQELGIKNSLKLQ